MQMNVKTERRYVTLEMADFFLTAWDFKNAYLIAH